VERPPAAALARPAGFAPACRMQVVMALRARPNEIIRVRHAPPGAGHLRPLRRPGLLPTVFGLVLVAGLLLVATTLLYLGHEPAGYLVAGAGFGMIAGAFVMRWAAIIAIDRPLDKVASSMETLAARDALALVDEFASLAQGDPPRDLSVHAEPVDLPAAPGVRRVAEALNSTISRLRAGAYQFRAASADPCRRLFYVGADDYLLGCTCAEVMGGLLPDGGQVLLLSPTFRHAGVELRRRGFESTILERFPNLHVAGVAESVFGTPSETPRTANLVRNFLRTHPQLAGVYSTEAYGALGAMVAIQGTPMAGRLVIVGHDILDETIVGLQAGLIGAVVTQDPFGQGHDTVIHMFNAAAHGWRPSEPRLISHSDVVTRDNYHDFWRPYEGQLETPAMHERRPRPLGPARKHLRIALMGIEDGSFWEPVKQGVMAAAQDLEACNATVEWMVPEKGFDFDVETRGQAIERLAEEGYDAIATPVYDSDLVPYLNRAIARGVTVATLNAESSSLQTLVATLSKERRRLEIAAGTLEAAARHDPLTGALNRLVMDADLEDAQRQTVASRKPASVIMMDIDHFKAYNDMVGHTAGDEVLRMVAQRIQAEVRPVDRVYRYGGEEFLVLLRDSGIDESQRVAARICDGVASLGLPHEQNPPWGVVTVSAGVSTMEPDGSPWPDVVAAADSALYRSKASGRNTVATAQLEPMSETPRRHNGRGHGHFD
jgi:diguanylate cyclase (GGDEF)-like protein